MKEPSSRRENDALQLGPHEKLYFQTLSAISNFQSVIWNALADAPRLESGCKKKEFVDGDSTYELYNDQSEASLTITKNGVETAIRCFLRNVRVFDDGEKKASLRTMKDEERQALIDNLKIYEEIIKKHCPQDTAGRLRGETRDAFKKKL